jgi:hypothetical protein
MIGLNTQTWYASEAFHDGIYSFFCFANFDRLDFRQIVWSSQDDTWNVIQPDTFRVFNMYWDRNEMATGSEVALCIAAHETLLKEGVRSRVVSMPSWELFEHQPAEYKDSVIPPGVTARVSVEQASTLGWDRSSADGRQIGRAARRPAPQGRRRVRLRDGRVARASDRPGQAWRAWWSTRSAASCSSRRSPGRAPGPQVCRRGHLPTAPPTSRLGGGGGNAIREGQAELVCGSGGRLRRRNKLPGIRAAARASRHRAWSTTT